MARPRNKGSKPGLPLTRWTPDHQTKETVTSVKSSTVNYIQVRTTLSSDAMLTNAGSWFIDMAALPIINIGV